MDDDALVLESAGRHRVSDADARHAWAFAVDAWDLGDGFVMYVGPDLAGRVLEIGVVSGTESSPSSMPCPTAVPEVIAMPRSLDELIAQADAFADKFGHYEPSDDDRGEPALMALRGVAYQRSLIERDLAEAVRNARTDGLSWAKIGKELGTSGEAARQRYGDTIDA